MQRTGAPQSSQQTAQQALAQGTAFRNREHQVLSCKVELIDGQEWWCRGGAEGGQVGKGVPYLASLVKLCLKPSAPTRCKQRQPSCVLPCPNI